VLNPAAFIFRPRPNQELLRQEGFIEHDLPIIIDVVDDARRIEKVLRRLDEIIRGGLITLEAAHLVLYWGTESNTQSRYTLRRSRP